MASTVKIILGFAVIGALLVGYLGFKEVSRRQAAEQNLQDTQGKLDETSSKLKKANADLIAANQAKDAVQNDLTQTESKLTDVNQQVSTLQTQADQLKQAVTQGQATVAAAQQKFDDLNKQLDGKSPEQIKAEAEKVQQDLTAAKSESRILEDALQNKQAEIDKWIKAFTNMQNGSKMPPLAGKVTFVNRTWNFVVLNVGVSHGVVPNGELIVYRNKQFLGKLKVTSAESTTSIADILPDAKGDIQVGDDVLN